MDVFHCASTSFMMSMKVHKFWQDTYCAKGHEVLEEPVDGELWDGL